MQTIFYTITAAALGIAAIYTGEFVTFVLLGWILLALNNILFVLKDIAKKLERKE